MTMISFVIFAFCLTLTMAMKWSFVNDAMRVYIRIVTAYLSYRMVPGFVSLVRLFDDQLVYSVQSGPIKCRNLMSFECFYLIDLVDR